MKGFSLLLVLSTAAMSLAATCSGSKQCQCLFSDGSHCCLYGQNAQTGDTYDCTTLCSGASRLLQSGEDTPAKCNAGGSFACASLITAQGRTPCYNNA
ncbi:hypothetical protein N7541_011118 [Penicillium brevicompactum]|uniref:Uncharacterized protein n=1 Tax=Penicillium brevicompactum TaxID=5074 RepID=A0A9W9QMD6_PENBR|nr:uncharacterized protein N7506_009150 [Penicillium brevicompactum]KAJ5326048.1 hypothetical protein N7506_009150 [Penicillium brevicompactum]KAJ5339149.1 hypothetical protein N7452_005877 [Penicillium brevicompactum]KAJ5341994.1 hypothetical protein N7541_011118 [Penicillium brevicompactum]